ncbi:MAG TPA: hypothetical protein VKE24_15250 [Candidatus Acidoferrales bacterium]|nr:hypothetical protein [Candidatus Acidoferrales bacterium]
MNYHTRPTFSTALARPLLILVAFLTFSLNGALPAAGQASKSKEKKFEVNTPWGGFSASDQATLKEVGLPGYPGARPRKETTSNGPEAKLSFWTESLGIKLVAVKFESDDTVEEVSEFYRKALAKYGKVLTCTGAEKKAAAKDERSNELDCSDAKSQAGGVELRAGTKERRHIVAIGPKDEGKGLEFALVYLEMRNARKQTQ